MPYICQNSYIRSVQMLTEYFKQRSHLRAAVYATAVVEKEEEDKNEQNLRILYGTQQNNSLKIFDFFFFS